MDDSSSSSPQWWSLFHSKIPVLDFGEAAAVVIGAEETVQLLQSLLEFLRLVLLLLLLRLLFWRFFSG